MPDTRARPRIALTIGDRDWLGWTLADITQTIEAVTGAFSIGLSHRWPGADQPPPIAPGLACRVTVDGEPLITGYIDTVAPYYSAAEHGVTISGRDRTGDLVDCSAAVEPGEWYDIGLAGLVAAIAQPFGIGVFPDPELNLGDMFGRFRVQAGETAFAAIERATRARAVLPIARPDGHLRLTRAPIKAGIHPPAIVLGGDRATPVAARGSFEAQERYRDYRLLAQAGGEGGDAAARAHIVATAGDPEVGRYRPLVIVASDRLDAAAAAAQIQWEANVRRGRARRVSYTIAGWRDDDGRLWRPNTIVRVKDDWLKIDHELLLVSVRMTIYEETIETSLELADPAAYLRETDISRDAQELGW